MSLRAWESLSADDKVVFRDAARKSSRFMRELWAGWEQRSRQQATAAGNMIIADIDKRPFEQAMSAVAAQGGDRSGPAPIDRAHSPGAVSFDLAAIDQEQPARPGARSRRSLDLETEGFVRALPIRWRLFLLAALNGAVAVILAALIWNGANTLSRAWDEVRRVRESDKLLVLLESEASRLQNLIHRYINQPNAEVFAEILRLHGEVLSTLRNRGAARSGHVQLGRRAARGDRAVSARLRRGARGPGDDHPHLRERSAQAGQGNGRALRHRRGRHRQARRPAAAFARKVARGFHREPGRRQCLLPVARLGSRRRSAPKHRDSRADHSGHDRSRRERSAARRAFRAGAARRCVPRRPAELDRAVRDAHQSLEDRDRRQSGRHDRGHQPIVRADDAARAAGAGKLRPYARRHLSERGARRRHLSDRHRRRSAC